MFNNANNKLIASTMLTQTIHIISMLLNLFLPIKNTVIMKNNKQYHIGLSAKILTFIEDELTEADSMHIKTKVSENINI
ncbi:hypothetical protein SNUCP2_07900 [Clostridium perfringens A]